MRAHDEPSYAQELTRRLQENPHQRLGVVKEFYSEMVKAGKREEADWALLVITLEEDKRKIPGWFYAAGVVFGGLTFLFLMGLIFASVIGHEVPIGSRFLVVAMFALGCAMSTAFLGGEAAASGKIPFFGNAHPLVISATGGIAVLIIVLLIGHQLYH